MAHPTCVLTGAGPVMPDMQTDRPTGVQCSTIVRLFRLNIHAFIHANVAGISNGLFSSIDVQSKPRPVSVIASLIRPFLLIASSASRTSVSFGLASGDAQRKAPAIFRSSVLGLAHSF